MTRLAIVVEGQTEREFVQHILAEYLRPKKVYLYPMSLGGGNINVVTLASYMANCLRNFDCVSSLVDFYGFRSKGNTTPDELENSILEEINRRKTPSWGDTPVIPYVQLHEFESLLFSKVDAFAETQLTSNAALQQLSEIRSCFSTPEDINDSYQTAPSKRITQIVRRYNKPVHGYLIAKSIGVEAIRAECPRFNKWLAKLEALGNNPPSQQ